MKKHNGHSNGHVTSHTPPMPPIYLQADPGAALAKGPPLIGHAPHQWETALAETRVKPAVHPTRPVPPGKAAKRAPATSKSLPLSRILLQPNIVNAVAIDDTGVQGIGVQLREGGVMARVDAWSPMQVGDVLELFWGVPDNPQSPGYPGSATVSKTLQFPEELNKPVLLAIPEEKIVAGWFNVVCRVTRANTGYQEMSPPLRVLVKLAAPGGIDPAPDENPNLAAPILPPEVIANGVDTEWAANGVPVTIQPYPNMAVGDRIRLNWGGSFVEYTLRDSSEVGQPVTLIVDEATIRAAGDGDAVAVRYQVFDVVNNRSGWSPTVDVVVNVQGDALFLPEVKDADENGVIDLALLGSNDVRVWVTAFEPDFAVGDVVTLQWMGHTEEGVPVPYEDSQTVTQGPIQTLEFFIPNASVVALAQGDAVVSYSLQSGRSSKQVRVTIVGNAVQLPAPTVDEAPNDYDELDASLSLATVRIAPYPSMDAGDIVTLIWSGTRADGVGQVYSASRQISGSAVGKEVTFAVPGAEIALLAGGMVELWYEVIASDGTHLRPSQKRTLTVSAGQGFLLPAPSVDEAPDNATLDPNVVGLYAEVRIVPYAGMAIGDRVDMYWLGSDPNGSMNDWITVGAATLNKPLLFDVDKAYVVANDGGTVMVRYTVTPQGGSTRSSTTLTLRVGTEQAVVPAITSVTDSQGEVANGGTTNDTTVTLSGTASANTSVELIDNGTISHGTASVGEDNVWRRAVTRLADGNHHFTAKGLYGNEPVSPEWNFIVAPQVGLAMPVVIEADPYSQTLSLLKPIDSVHVSVDYAGMAIGDVVTMVWQGTPGSGSDQQTHEVTALGPLIFTVPNSAITPNVGQTVRVYYIVQRTGMPGAPIEESLPLNLRIENIALEGTTAFSTGTTSFYRCTAGQASYFVSDELGIGARITVTPLVSPSATSAFRTTSLLEYPSHCGINLVGNQPGSTSNLFPTGIPGVGFRLWWKVNNVNTDELLFAGPKIGVKEYSNLGDKGAIEFVKIGPVTRGTLQPGVLGQWKVGANGLYFMGWQLMKAVSFSNSPI